MGIIGQYHYQVNGLSASLLLNYAQKHNGAMAALLNVANDLNGVQAGLGNYSYKINGIQYSDIIEFTVKYAVIFDLIEEQKACLQAGRHSLSYVEALQRRTGEKEQVFSINLYCV